jgi:hypothetical protein
LSVAALIKAMRAAGVEPDKILATVEVMEQERLAKGRLRQSKHRNSKRNGDVPSVTKRDECDTPLSPKEIPPTPPKEITPIPVSEPRGSSTKSAREFAEFWELFPNKVGKRVAEDAFVKALKRAPFDAIMAGLRRYAAKTDDRQWLNPSTFLNQNRWEDQPAAPPQRTATGPPADDFNTILDGYINGSRYDVSSQPNHSFDAGNGGPDRRSAQGVVQLHALPARR